MALLHRATLNPTKGELLAAWLDTRSWSGDLGDARPVASYRFDDPDGEVGLDATLLVGTATDVVVHVPLTYRATPLDGAQEHLVGVTEHSVLGARWVYDGGADPLWISTLASVLTAGGAEAQQYFQVGDHREPYDAGMTVRGSGSPATALPGPGPIVSTVDTGGKTVVQLARATMVVVRVVGTPLAAPERLVARWGSRREPLAALVRH